MTESQPLALPEKLRQAFLSFGFKPTSYPKDAAEYLTMQKRVREMPYLLANVADGETVGEEDLVVVDVLPTVKVQMHIIGTDYTELPEPLFETKGETIVLGDQANGILLDLGLTEELLKTLL